MRFSEKVAFLVTERRGLMWSVVVRFNQLGTIGYYCDQHGDTTSGMRGAITVIDRVFVDGFDTASPPS